MLFGFAIATSVISLMALGLLMMWIVGFQLELSPSASSTPEYKGVLSALVINIVLVISVLCILAYADITNKARTVSSSRPLLIGVTMLIAAAMVGCAVAVHLYVPKIATTAFYKPFTIGLIVSNALNAVLTVYACSTTLLPEKVDTRRVWTDEEIQSYGSSREESVESMESVESVESVAFTRGDDAYLSKYPAVLGEKIRVFGQDNDEYNDYRKLEPGQEVTVLRTNIPSMSGNNTTYALVRAMDTTGYVKDKSLRFEPVVDENEHMIYEILNISDEKEGLRRLDEWLDRRINPNIVMRNTDTPLYLSTFFKPAYFKRLIEAGANADVENVWENLFRKEPGDFGPLIRGNPDLKSIAQKYKNLITKKYEDSWSQFV